MNKNKVSPNRRLLLIDDNAAIHDDFRKIFAERSDSESRLHLAAAAFFEDGESGVEPVPFECDSALQGRDGVILQRRAVESGRPYAVAFVDLLMPPGWDGVETIERLWKVDPDLHVVICTAYSEYSLDEIQAALGVSDRLVILKKPFDPIEVQQLAHALTEKWRLLRQSRAETVLLEQRVAERTAELQAANEHLQTEIARRSQAEEGLRHAQKMEAVGQLAGGIAHDFNNLITVIQTCVDLALTDQGLSAETAEALEAVDFAGQRAASLTEQLLAFSRKQVSKPEHLDLGELMARVTALLNRVLGKNIDLTVTAADEMLCVHADRAMVEMVMLNLAVNAREAMPDGGRLVIQTDRVEIDEEEARTRPDARSGPCARIRFEDSGSGIAPEVLPRIFEPFFTAGRSGKGTGLGLAMVYGIVRQHHGWIGVRSVPGEGATFEVFLPLAERAKILPRVVVSTAPADGGNETILLVEDDSDVRKMARKILQRYGYSVLEARDGVEAIRVWRERASEIDLLFTDMVMPGGVSGMDLLLQVRGENSDLPVILTSGYTRQLEENPDSVPVEIQFLPKPYTVNQLTDAVRACLDSDACHPVPEARSAIG